MNPYQVLGVRKNASANTIRNAFRKKSLETHPDRGGSVDAFAAVKLAYEVLSNSERRRRYDETGCIDETKADNSRVPAMQAIHQHLVATIQGLMAKSSEPHKNDLLKLVRKRFTDERVQMDESRRSIDKALELLTALRGRFHAENDVLSPMIEGEIRQVQGQLDALTAAQKVSADALEVLETHRFDMEEPKHEKHEWTLLGTSFGGRSKIFIGTGAS